MENCTGYSNCLKHGSDRVAESGKSLHRTSMILLLVLLFILGTAAGMFPSVQAASVTTIETGAVWRYVTGAQAPPDNWTSPDFDDSGWMQGPAGFGYGPGNYMTFLHDMQGIYNRVHVRREFTVADPFSVTRMSLSVECDASFAAFINGIEVIRNDVPLHEEFDISGFIHELHSGNNVIAVRCDNDNRESSSFSFKPVFEVSYE